MRPGQLPPRAAQKQSPACSTEHHNSCLGGWQRRATTEHTKTPPGTSLNEKRGRERLILTNIHWPRFAAAEEDDHHLHKEQAAGLSQLRPPRRCVGTPGSPIHPLDASAQATADDYRLWWGRYVVTSRPQRQGNRKWKLVCIKVML